MMVLGFLGFEVFKRFYVLGCGVVEVYANVVLVLFDGHGDGVAY